MARSAAAAQCLVLACLVFGTGLLRGADAQAVNMADTICRMKDATYFCKMIKLASADPIVSQFYSPDTVATLFVPTDRGMNNTRRLITLNTGATITTLTTDLAQATRFIRSHLVLGNATDFRTFHDGDQFWNTLFPQQPLYVIQGNGRYHTQKTQSYFIRGPVNTVRAGFQDRWNIIGGKALMHVVEDPIIPKIGTV